MAFVYHLVPPEMVGQELVPLNELRNNAPQLYERRRRYYQGREHVMDTRIALLGNCRWNDVLFFTPIHPAKFRAALPARFDWSLRFFEVAVSALDPTRMAFMLAGRSAKQERFAPFDATLLEKYRNIPEHTYAYYAHCAKKRMCPRPFLGTTHVLFRGTLDVSGLRITEA